MANETKTLKLVKKKKIILDDVQSERRADLSEAKERLEKLLGRPVSIIEAVEFLQENIE
jgi:hypothetical protein